MRSNAIPFTGFDPLAEYPNVDGVVALTHKTGCGMAEGEPLQLLRRTLAGYARHPNFSHVVVLGLGCEVNQIGEMLKEHKLTDRIRSMDIQSMGGTRKTVEAGMAFVREVLADVEQCAAPDGARERAEGCPAMRRFGRLFGRLGQSRARDRQRSGGAQRRHGDPLGNDRDLWRRAYLHASRRQPRGRREARRTDAVVEDYTHKHGAEINANPSPGNKAGGLTTILEKSLGAMAKAGSTNLVDVIKYAEAVTATGFVFMDTPGFDPVSATGQVAGGANVICFTTGRGSVFGCKPAPSIKIATNTALYQRMEEDMDVNCGTILDGEETVQEAGQRIFELSCGSLPASGRRARCMISDRPSSHRGRWA